MLLNPIAVVARMVPESLHQGDQGGAGHERESCPGEHPGDRTPQLPPLTRAASGTKHVGPTCLQRCYPEPLNRLHGEPCWRCQQKHQGGASCCPW
ncbi:radial spoke head 10-like protein B [Platysternon megacephalum]|uniref:Radial spoke head 10-like protein B n=1 Tax=Platysternon megacephalum TaxID=55544 RepID=A0A4D9DYW4_9SAUR|nr:radial spoke head 10-like protein B [Platysternon megacephalum]